MTDAGNVVYRVDAQDRLVFVNDEWDRFAAANAGQACLSAKVLGRPLWDFVSDRTTRLLYGNLLAKVRAGGSVRFPFRCDSPDCRRFLEMAAVPAGRGAVEFTVRTAALEPRPALALLDPAIPRDEELLRVCGWCKKVEIDGLWYETEVAVAKLGLFGAHALPLVTHGMCLECEAAMSKTLGA